MSDKLLSQVERLLISILYDTKGKATDNAIRRKGDTPNRIKPTMRNLNLRVWPVLCWGFGVAFAGPLPRLLDVILDLRIDCSVGMHSGAVLEGLGSETLSNWWLRTY